MNIPRTEFAAALSQVAAERGIDPNQVIDSIKLAIVTAYKKDFGADETLDYEAEIDSSSGETRLFCWLIDEPGKRKEITPPGYGRIAAQQARNIIVQKIREAEKNALLEDYEKRVGSLINGMILRFDGDNVVVDLGKGEAIMPADEQNREESYHLNMKLTFYIEGIRETIRGRQIIVSRSHEGLVENLFKREVPEINSGAVEIRAIAREAGSRTKIAVISNQPGIDPVGSCVGQRGIRVQAVIGELNGEKIDIVQFNEDPERFILAALSPAENLKVKINLDKMTAVVIAPPDQLSLAIGKGGQNVRLAIKLTKYRIDIEGDHVGELVNKPEETVTPAKTKTKAATATKSKPAKTTATKTKVVKSTTEAKVKKDKKAKPAKSAE